MREAAVGDPERGKYNQQGVTSPWPMVKDQPSDMQA